MSWPVLPLGLLGSQASTSDNDTYQVSRSLRFNSLDSAYLSRTPASASNRTTWTWSGWVKRSSLGGAHILMEGGSQGTTDSAFYFDSNDNLDFFNRITTSVLGRRITSQAFRDVGSWFHLVFVWDSANATASERMKIYVNGSQVTSFSSQTNPTPSEASSINNSVLQKIGATGAPTPTGGYFGGYLAEVNFVDGQALTPSSFGETDATTGRWKAKAFTGTYGTNGFYLPFLNTSTGSNSVLTSEDFSAAMYTKDASSVTTNTTTAPNGATTADTLTENSATATHRFYFNNLTYTNGVTFTSSIYVKANTRSAVALENWNGTAANYCYADLSNGTIISGSHASAAITSVGNGWYRISVSNVGTGGAACGSALYIKNNATAGSLSYAGNGSGSFFVWGMQTEASSTVGPYLPTNGTAFGSSMIFSDASVSTGGYNSWVANNLSVTPGTGNDSLTDSPTNFGAISTTLAPDTYQISKSLRFNSLDSAYLNRTPASAGNRKTWTWSGWVKRSSSAYQQIFNSYIGSGTTDTNYFEISFFNDNINVTGYSTTYLRSTAVYRDFSAWYHIVVTTDTTTATADNRIKIYVNGAEITSFSTRNNPTPQSVDLGINAAYGHYLGGVQGNAYYLSAYLTEINFIDGQALTPSSFGTRDINTYLWKPKAYTGTYGTNGFYLNFSDSSNTTATTLGKDQAGSNNWTPNNFSVTAGPGNDSLVDSPTYYGTDAGVGGEVRGDYATLDPLNNSGVLSNGNLVFQASTTATQVALGTSKIIPSGKTYFEVNVVTAAGSGTFFQVGIAPQGKSLASAIGTVSGNGYAIEQEQANDIQLRLNGSTVVISAVMQTGDVLQVAVDHATGKLWFGRNNIWYSSSGATTGNPAAGTNQSAIISTVADWFPAVAKYNTGGSYAINFGQRPFAYTAPSGFKALRDYNKLPVPTGGEVRGNYATLNPLDAVAVTSTTNGNLDVSLSASGSANIRSTIAVSSGKWFWEVLFGSTGDTLMVGACDATVPNASSLWSTANAWMYYSINGQKYNGSGTSYGATFTNGDLIGVALDMDNGTISFYKNGVSQGQAYSGLTGRTLTPTIQSTARALTATANFGQRPWAYDAPFGFKPLCTTLLPQPIVQKSSTAMDVVTYTGNGSSSRSITGLGFSPDLVWLKACSLPYTHGLHDTVRGASRFLATQATNGDIVNEADGSISAYNSDGFTISSGTNSNNTFNTNTGTYVGWAWDAGSSSVTNTSGAISSTVRANPQAGVSVVSFVNASGTNQSTVGHGLGSSPKMIIAKNRDTSANNWAVFHSSVCDTTSKFLQLNTTAALTTFATVWGASLPSSSVFGVTGGGIAAASVNMIAYCFAEVEGFSKFGFYTGNGSADGPFVFCEFRPRWVLVKSSSSAQGWQIIDASRSQSNVATQVLQANSLNADTTVTSIDIISNGFKIRSDGASLGINTSSATYIFAAFAEAPFKYSRAR